MHYVSISMKWGLPLLSLRYTDKSNCPVVMLLGRTNQKLSHENCAPKSLFFYDPENKIFYVFTSEIRAFRSFLLVLGIIGLLTSTPDTLK